MGKDLKGKEIGKGIYQRKDGLYHARIYASGYSKPISFYGHDLKELKEKGIYSIQKKIDFKPVKNPEAENQCLSDEEIDVFFSAAENARYKEIFYILLHTGLRSGELCALEWDDIDTKNGFIHVYKTLNRITKYYDKNGFKLKEPLHVIQITSPKREASNRYIPMTDEVKDAFYNWKKKQDHDKAEIGRKWGKSNQLLREYPNLIFTDIFREQSDSWGNFNRM